MKTIKEGDKIVSDGTEYPTGAPNGAVMTVKEVMAGYVSASVDGGDDYLWCMPYGSFSAHQPKGQTLAELGVKAGDVVRCVTNPDSVYIGELCTINDDLDAVLHIGGKFMSENDTTYGRTYRIVSRATPQPPIFRDMTDAEKGALLLAKHNRQTVQYWNPYQSKWFDDDEPEFIAETAYRIKPTTETRKVWIGPVSGIGMTEVLADVTYVDGQVVSVSGAV